MSGMLLKTGLKDRHALWGGGRACSCCEPFGGRTSKGRKRTKRKLTKLSRRIEKKFWQEAEV